MIECYEDAVLGATLPPLTIDLPAGTLREAIGDAVRAWSRTALVREIRMLGQDTPLSTPVDLSARVYARHLGASGEVQLQICRNSVDAATPVAMAKVILPSRAAAAQRA